MNRFIALLSLIMILLPNIIGQEMITNFISQDGDKYANPSGFVTLNNKMLFASTTENFGREIWILNNQEKPILLKDINPGCNDGLLADLSNTSVILNNELYFIASDGQSKGEIWKTDGTHNGTIKVTEFLDAQISKLTLVNNKIYFLNQNENQLQVWLSDGTSKGTSLVQRDIAIDNTPYYQGKCHHLFAFAFQQSGEKYSRLWVSNGNKAGTIAITPPLNGNGEEINGYSPLSHFIEYHNELYFTDKEYLYKTDGTRENTVPLMKIADNITSSCDYGDATIVNNTLYVSFFDFNAKTLTIIASDGTPGTTRNIYQQKSDSSFMSSNLLAYHNQLIFITANANGQSVLATMDHQNHNIEIIQTINNPITTSSNVGYNKYLHQCQLQIINDDYIFCTVPKNYFTIDSWISGLTKETTHLIDSLNDVSCGFAYNNSFYFSHKSANIGAELWQLNPDNKSLALISNINKCKFGISNPFLTVLHSNLIFTADNGTFGNELWKYDGQKTSLVKDFNQGAQSSSCHSMIQCNNDLFFVANSTQGNCELWKTDGNNEGTKMVCNLLKKHNYRNPSDLFVYKNELYLTAQKDSELFLCKSNGKKLDIIKNLGMYKLTCACNEEKVIQIGDALYFVTHNNIQSSLWISNGTEEGTKILHSYSCCGKLTAVNNQLFFIASENEKSVFQLWVTNGTIDSTRKIDINTPTSLLRPDNLIELQGKLLFTAYTEKSGRELWISDGSNKGTYQLCDISPGINNTTPQSQFCKFNNEVYFSANDGITGYELWKTDGSIMGTLKVKDINNGAESSHPSHLTAVNNVLYFQAFDTTHGTEIWKSDGTEGGTSLVADIIPGVYSSSPSQFIGTDNNIYFVANSSDSGRQIWRISNNDTFTLKNKNK